MKKANELHGVPATASIKHRRCILPRNQPILPKEEFYRICDEACRFIVDDPDAIKQDIDIDKPREYVETAISWMTQTAGVGHRDSDSSMAKSLIYYHEFADAELFNRADV